MRAVGARGEDGRVATRSTMMLAVLVVLVLGAAQMKSAQSPRRSSTIALTTSPSQAAEYPDPADPPSRSTTIALTSDERRVVVVNREANSVSVIEVQDANGLDVAIKLFEIGV